MTFSQIVQSITRETIVPKVYDTILTGNVGLLRLIGNAIPWRSGFRYDVPIKYAKSTVGGLVGLGGTLDTDRQSNRVKLQFNPKRRHKPVVLDDIEITLNEGDERVLELLATEMDSLAMDLADDCGDDLYLGTGAGDQFDSLANSADDATNYATVGSLARATYTSLNGYLATAIGALALSDMSTFHNAIKFGSAKPSLILADVTSWTGYEGLLQPVVRAGYEAQGFPQVTRTGELASQRALGGDIGFDSIWYRGTPCVEDEKCPGGYMFGLNEEFFYFASIQLTDYEQINIGSENVEGPQAVRLARGFNWSGLMRSNQQPAQVGHLYLVGNYISADPRRTGVMQGITG